MMRETILPVVGLPACVHEIKDVPFHAVGDKYLRAVAVSAKALPVIIPSLGDIVDIEAIVASLDGLLMTGSPSNVHPSHYDTAPSLEAEPYDRIRDSTSLPLIRVALDQGLPLFAICRGFQELNVVLGGSLHARVHEITGRMDHRRPIHPDPDVQYGPKHKVVFTPESEIAEILGTRELEVNSLHWQALDNVAEDLVVEGRAADQTVEAVRVKNAKSFAIGVQWHPEYKSTENAASTRLFEAFGAAARARSAARQAS
jgi:putative glutamine amidotransferase